jgi:tetrahydromethanopterin S-methyltransferase subunit G
MSVSAPEKKWTDHRLDDLNQKVDDGFAKVDARFEKVEGKIEGGIKELRKELNERFCRF